MFDPLFDVITGILAWFFTLWDSYGMSIAFLTLTATIAVTPLTLKATRSTLQMQQYAPELKKIQNQHRGDRQAMNEATMAFYREHGFNPIGCALPMLVQGPIFLVMYRVVHGLTRRSTEIGTQLGFTSLDYARTADGVSGQYGKTPIVRGELTFDPDFLSRDNDLYRRLSDSTEMVSWGVDLSRSASSALSDGVITSLPYLFMMLIVLVTGLLQHRQIQGRQTNTAMHPQQQMIMKLVPYILPVVSFSIPAAVVVYFIVSNLVRIAQQAYITRSFYRGEDSLGSKVAKQRAEAVEESKQAKTSKATTERKGSPTPKRDGKPARAKAPARNKATTSRNRPRKGGITGKAPARGASSSKSVAERRSAGESRRTTPTGAKSRPSNQNRSRKARKRR